MNEGNPQAGTKPWQDASPAPAHDSLAPDPAQAFGDYWHALGDAWAHWAANWEQWTARGFAQPHAPPADRRFAAPEWQTPYFAMLRDAYLASSRYWQEAVESAELPPREKDRLRFAVRQWLDAVSPTNFPATNPEAIKLAIATEGESLRKGAENLLTDLTR